MADPTSAFWHGFHCYIASFVSAEGKLPNPNLIQKVNTQSILSNEIHSCIPVYMHEGATGKGGSCIWIQDWN